MLLTPREGKGGNEGLFVRGEMSNGGYDGARVGKPKNEVRMGLFFHLRAREGGCFPLGGTWRVRGRRH